MQFVTLSNGVKMPQLGYGVYQVSKEECERCVLNALEVGYRHIDTAQRVRFCKQNRKKAKFGATRWNGL